MEALKDIWASLVDGVKERTTNPLSFAFLVSWCAWNFKFFVVLFGDGTAMQRLDTLDWLYPHTVATLHSMLTKPLLTALLYVFAYPFFSAWAIKFYRQKQVEIANAVKEVEEKRVQPLEESRSQTLRHERDRRDWEETTREADRQIQELRDALAELEKQKSEMLGGKNTVDLEQKDVNPPSSLEDTPGPGGDILRATGTVGPNPIDTVQHGQNVSQLFFTDDILQILEFISNTQAGHSASAIAKHMLQNLTVTEVKLDDLARAELVFKNVNDGWKLTDGGKALFLRAYSDRFGRLPSR